MVHVVENAGPRNIAILTDLGRITHNCFWVGGLYYRLPLNGVVSTELQVFEGGKWVTVGVDAAGRADAIQIYNRRQAA